MANGTKAKDFKFFVQRRCDQYDIGNWKGLTKDYEADIVAARLVHWNDDRSGKTKDDAKLQKVLDFLDRMQWSKPCKYLQSNGLVDHTGDAIIQQIM